MLTSMAHAHANGQLCGQSHAEAALSPAHGPAAGDVAERASSTGLQVALGESEEEQAAREEREALGKIAHAIREYKNDAEWEVRRWEANHARLSAAHKKLVPDQPSKFKLAKQCVGANHLFLKSLLASFEGGGPAPEHLSEANAAADEWRDMHPQVHPGDVEKVRYVLKNLMRDWSAEGAPERSQSYGRIVQELQLRFADWPRDRPPPQVLVPGAGLGRLCLEVAALGYEAQGNEFSYYMLLASSFLLNHMQRPNQWTLFPWLHTNCNQRCVADQFRAVTVPDALPGSMLPAPGLLSMCAGDFVEVYGRPGSEQSFDCVATCFFIDTAHNILEYMEVIWRVLRDGGVWINLGPLLYHWADAHTYLPEGELSIELSLEEVQAAAQAIGFQVLQRQNVAAAYMANLKSMLKSSYNAVFWTMQKPALATR